MSPPRISVVVTAYNHEKYISQCLDSILMQQGKFDLEVILGDDCSEDRTRQIMTEYAEAHHGVFVLLPPTTNMGVTRNIKRCLDACSGDYIAFCEGDDYWFDRYKLQKQMEFLESDPDYSLCFNAIMMCYEAEGRYVPLAEQLLLNKDTLTIEDLIEANYIGNFSCCMYRADTVRRLPAALFDILTWDWMFNMACSRLGKIGFIRDWMSVYRKHEEGASSGMEPIDHCRQLSAAIDTYDRFFHYEYHKQFRKRKEDFEQHIHAYEEQLHGKSGRVDESTRHTLNQQVSFMKKWGHLLIRAIRHPGRACSRLSSALSVGISELTTGAVSAKDARIETLRLQVPVKHVDLLVLDTLFPHPLSRFRLEEFCAYLKQFRSSMVLSTGDHFPAVKESRKLDTIIHEFETTYPQFTGRVRATTHEIDGYSARVAYLIFLNNVSYFLESLESRGIPFVFTLYPGGGFAINQESSDAKLRRVFSSARFRRVIVTQQITYDYLVKNNLCPEDRIMYLYGGVMPLDTLEKSDNYERAFFGSEKDSLDICFVAVKYMPMGVDKGYDVFIEAAKRLAQLHSNVSFHVVGNFTEADVPINGLEGRITFYGFRELDWFDGFYADKDIILSPNVPFRLLEGAFDGFPTAACVEAGLRKVAVFCTDELKLNNHFADNEEIVIIPHDVDRIVRIIEDFYERPDKLRSLAEKGAAKMQEVFCYESQILPRIRLLESELKGDGCTI